MRFGSCIVASINQLSAERINVKNYLKQLHATRNISRQKVARRIANENQSNQNKPLELS
jgi:hypothetical protein